jgi:cytochrome c
VRAVALILLLAAAAVLAGCSTRGALYHPTLSTSWSASRGKALIEYYGCGSCHVIGGVPDANGHVGPPLTNFGRRYHQIAGVLPNTPRNVVRWIMNPPQFVPKVDMPVLGIGPQGAGDITAYLYGQ